jgi:hypothetical protein
LLHNPEIFDKRDVLEGLELGRNLMHTNHTDNSESECMASRWHTLPSQTNSIQVKCDRYQQQRIIETKSAKNNLVHSQFGLQAANLKSHFFKEKNLTRVFAAGRGMFDYNHF